MQDSRPLPAAMCDAGHVAWQINGELALNCNCTVFCPCVVSLGRHPPTEGYCQTWAAIRIDRGHYGDADLAGLNVALLFDIPGLMARGNWKAAAYIDEQASDQAFDGLVRILSGRARGTTGLLNILVSEFLGAERAPVVYRNEGQVRTVQVGKTIQGRIVPIQGHGPNTDVVITNTNYWMGPDITVATAEVGRVRAHGRVWDFAGRSAEICTINWHGPDRRKSGK